MHGVTMKFIPRDSYIIMYIPPTRLWQRRFNMIVEFWILTQLFITIKCVSSWLKHCATSRELTGSIPDCVIGNFHWHNPSGRTVALGLTQPVIVMSTRNISWEVKTAGVYGWQPYHLHVPIVLKSGTLNLQEPSGPVQTCNGIALPI